MVILLESAMENNKVKNRKRKLEDSKAGESCNGTAKAAVERQIVDGMSASEITMVRRLAGNDPLVRKKTIRKLRKWLNAVIQRIPANSDCRNDIEPNVIRVWKALFYCMWMADKPLPQEQLAEQISDLVSIFAAKPNAFLIFVEWFFRTMAREWSWIDRLRLDKFMMMFRRFIRKTFQALSDKKWKADALDAFLKIIRTYVFNHYPQSIVKKGISTPSTVTCPVGLQIHLIDIYLEEVAKVDAENLKSPKIIKLILPFIEEMASSDDERVLDEIKEKIFYHLMKQSDVGIDYQEGISPGDEDEQEDSLEEAEDDDEQEQDEEVEEEETTNGISNMQDEGDDEVFEADDGPLDPRAGAMDVVLPQLQVDYSVLAEKLAEAGGLKTVKKRNRGKLYTLASQFRELVEGKYPLALPEEEVWKPAIPKKELKKATNRLIEMNASEGGKKIRKTKKQRRRDAKKAQLNDETIGSEDQSAYLNDDDLIDHVSDNYASYVHEQMGKESQEEDQPLENDDDNLSICSDEELVISPKKKVKKMKKSESQLPPKKEKKYKTVIEVEAEEDANDELDARSFSSNYLNSQNEEIKTNNNNEQVIHIAQPKPKKKARDSLSLQKTTQMKAKSASPSSPKKKVNNNVNVSSPAENNSVLLGFTTPKTPGLKKLKQREKFSTPNSAGANKRVSFILARNSEHDATDYMPSISKSPAIPFDANKTPTTCGLLRAAVSKSTRRFSTPSGNSSSSALSPKRKLALDFF